MVKISSSLQDAIDEEPQRFIRGLDFDEINKAKNPQIEFLRQIEKRFDKPTGIYLWKFLVDNYSTTNKVYKMEIVQENLDEDLPENLNKEVVKDFYKNYNQRKSNEQDRRERKLKKQIGVSQHIREGKEIKEYNRTRGHKYTRIQENFLKSKLEVSTKSIADQFNNAFGTSQTTIAIRDKRLRLLGRKK